MTKSTALVLVTYTVLTLCMVDNNFKFYFKLRGTPMGKIKLENFEAFVLDDVLKEVKKRRKRKKKRKEMKEDVNAENKEND